MTEKSISFETYKGRIKDYVSEIKKVKSEAHKVAVFLDFLKDTLLKDTENFVEIEKSVKKNGAFIGRVDLNIGKVIIEFKTNLTKKNLRGQGLKELKKYFSSDQFKDSPIGILTDGIRFEVYDRNLNLIEKFKAPNLSSESQDEEDSTISFLIKLDRYLLSKLKLPLTSKTVVEILGLGSTIYNRILSLLSDSFKHLQLENNKELKLYYEQWKKIISIIYGKINLGEELFLRHTYLSILVKLIAFITIKQIFKVKTPQIAYSSVIDGSFFKERGIYNYFEKDFFTWILLDEQTLLRICSTIDSILEEKFDFRNVSEDVLKDIYEDIILQRERHALGEYYTPDWLAEKILVDILTHYKEKILDPSCGSGTFLFKAIKLKKEKLSSEGNLLSHILNTVIGIDINPIATIIAKTNYLIALGDLLKERSCDIYIPIYNADSFKFPIEAKAESLFGNSFSVTIEGETLSIPYAKNNPQLTDSIIESIVEWANKYSEDSSFEEFLETNYPNVFSYLLKNRNLFNAKNTADKLRYIIKEKGDNIWTYILKNYFKPIFFKEQIDVVVGNPPWIAYRYLPDDFQEFVKEFMKSFGISIASKLMTHMEVATLFYVSAMANYLKEGGKIGFVLPYSIFTGDQQVWFRTRFIYENKRTRESFFNHITKLYDLSEIKPLFKVPSGVVIAKKESLEGREDFFIREIPTAKFYGRLPKRNLELKNAETYLSIEDTITGLVILSSERKYWIVGSSYQNLSNYKSKYRRLFKQGATINPRRLWFVRIVEDSLGFSKDKVPVVSDMFETDKLKIPPLTGNIPKEFLFKTVESRNIFLFGFCGYSNVVLPLKIERDRFKLVADEEKNIHKNLKNWLIRAKEIWETVKKPGSNLTIYQRLNYRQGLTQQSPNAQYISLYTTSGKNIASLVVKNDGRFIANSKTYYAYFEKEDEAYYITTILNSNLLNEIIKPFQSFGLLGERDIHTLPLEFPIPNYNENVTWHKDISHLGKICEQKVNDEVVKNLICNEKNKRTLSRYVIEFELNDIDRILYENTKLRIFTKEPQILQGISILSSLDDKEFKKILKKTSLDLIASDIEELKEILKALNKANLYPAKLTVRRYNPFDPSIFNFDIFHTAAEIVQNIGSILDFLVKVKDTIEALSLIYLILKKLPDFTGSKLGILYRHGDTKIVAGDSPNGAFLELYKGNQLIKRKPIKLKKLK